MLSLRTCKRKILTSNSKQTLFYREKVCSSLGDTLHRECINKSKKRNSNECSVSTYFKVWHGLIKVQLLRWSLFERARSLQGWGSCWGFPISWGKVIFHLRVVKSPATASRLCRLSISCCHFLSSVSYTILYI